MHPRQYRSICMGISMNAMANSQQLGIESPVDFALSSRVAIRLKRCDQGAQTRREDDRITGSCPRRVSVGNNGRHKHGLPWTCNLCSVGISKEQFSLKDMPSLVIGAVHAQCC